MTYGNPVLLLVDDWGSLNIRSDLDLLYLTSLSLPNNLVLQTIYVYLYHNLVTEPNQLIEYEE